MEGENGKQGTEYFLLHHRCIERYVLQHGRFQPDFSVVPSAREDLFAFHQREQPLKMPGRDDLAVDFRPSEVAEDVYLTGPATFVAEIIVELN